MASLFLLFFNFFVVGGNRYSQSSFRLNHHQSSSPPILLLRSATMFKTRFATVAALAVALMLLLAASPASADVEIRFKQVGANIHVTATGGLSQMLAGPTLPTSEVARFDSVLGTS